LVLLSGIDKNYENWINKKAADIHGQHHPKADVDRLYVPRKQGGRGLIQLEEAYSLEVMK
jgi:hypothetical protein